MIHIRPAGTLDSGPMSRLLNEIIRRGGTTALTRPVTAADLAGWMSRGRRAAWHLAEDEGGALQGFQWIEQVEALPPDAAEIATFVKVGQTGLGIGSRLFAATEAAARTLGYRWIRANIRADNHGGLAYYRSRGFEPYGRRDAVRLESGQCVDKILTRYDL